jgi:hypothetical protein
MKRPDYQGTLGFELVTLRVFGQMPVHLIREDGADPREATLTEQVLWESLTKALAALQMAQTIISRDPEPAEAAAAIAAALKSNGWMS